MVNSFVWCFLVGLMCPQKALSVLSQSAFSLVNAVTRPKPYAYAFYILMAYLDNQRFMERLLNDNIDRKTVISVIQDIELISISQSKTAIYTN